MLCTCQCLAPGEGGWAYPRGFDISAYFHVKFPAHGPNPAVKHPFPGVNVWSDMFNFQCIHPYTLNIPASTTWDPLQHRGTSSQCHWYCDRSQHGTDGASLCASHTLSSLIHHLRLAFQKNYKYKGYGLLHDAWICRFCETDMIFAIDQLRLYLIYSSNFFFHYKQTETKFGCIVLFPAKNPLNESGQKTYNFWNKYTYSTDQR